jgi:acetylornithine deacetylase
VVCKQAGFEPGSTITGAQMTLSRSGALLRHLISYPTVSRTSNLSLIRYISGLLDSVGVSCTIVANDDGTCANLFASTGPANVPGVILSGHTDVVTVEGQPWTVAPFDATVRDDRIYGRGSADMKGFVACAIVAMLDASSRNLRRPLQLALSYDEEIGCVGIRRLIEVLDRSPNRAQLCIVGEPTNMQIVTGHKGKTAYRAICCGEEGHSSRAPNYCNAIHVASDWINSMRATQREVAQTGLQDEAYDIPYSTLHVGTVTGGSALNIVPRRCVLDFEIRTLPEVDGNQLLDEVRQQFSLQSKVSFPQIEEISSYPGLNTQVSSAAVHFLESLLPSSTARQKVAFGTEGGLFSTRLSVPTLVCGPGNIEIAHKPDEYIELEQLQQCDAFLARLLESLT